MSSACVMSIVRIGACACDGLSLGPSSALQAGGRVTTQLLIACYLCCSQQRRHSDMCSQMNRAQFSHECRESIDFLRKHVLLDRGRRVEFAERLLHLYDSSSKRFRGGLHVLKKLFCVRDGLRVEF
jgi:hypothetical protein